MASTSKMFYLGYGRDLLGTACALKKALSLDRRLECQTVVEGEGEVWLQFRFKGHTLSRWMGLERAAAVRLTDLGNGQLAVSRGSIKWNDAAEPLCLMVLRSEEELKPLLREILETKVGEIIADYLRSG